MSKVVYHFAPIPLPCGGGCRFLRFVECFVDVAERRADCE